jgi:hypothetical protein
VVPEEWIGAVDRAHLEADAYTIFTELMNMVLPFYSGASWLPGQAESKQPFLYFRVQHIHYVLLHRHDPELFAHLESAMVLPHLYLIRWMRLLFTREVTIEQAFLVWDVILQSKGMELVDYVCIAMMSFIRDELLAEDAAHCLTKVFHYPALTNQQVLAVMRLARDLHDGVITTAQRSAQAKMLLGKVKNSMSKTIADVRVRAANTIDQIKEKASKAKKSEITDAPATTTTATASAGESGSADAAAVDDEDSSDNVGAVKADDSTLNGLVSPTPSAYFQEAEGAVKGQVEEGEADEEEEDE